ncbi:hypothetical protein AYO40_01300 [Planctomycetaceae bacterium SCGC AG-212-D15]|nr:hypothetical protein AYO40_01300 [Planctomycetaceae bacterium SCGC AG-212-D15]
MSAAPPTVLLVEDHTLFRHGLRALLESAVRVVGEAKDGPEALQLAKRLRPRVIIMDVAIPELNGIETARQILREQPDIRVIMLSMHENREYVYEAVRAGAVGYLLKDVAFAELLNAINAVVAGRTYFSQKVAEVAMEDYVRRATGEGPAIGLSALSDREREILSLIAEGNSSKEIARLTHLSSHTVDTHRRNIMKKLDIHDLAGLVKFALRHGLTSPH